MAKWMAPNAQYTYFDAAAVVDGKKTPTEMVKEFAEVSGQKPDAGLYEDLMAEEFQEWEDELASTKYLEGSKYKPELELKELADLLYVIYGYANARGWDVEEALKRVHENNMGRMYQPDGTIKRREDGKIMKNADYPKVYLEDLI